MKKFLLKLALCLFVYTGTNAQNPYITVWKTDNPSDAGTTDTQIHIQVYGTYTYQWEELSNPANNSGVIPIGPVTGSTTIEFPTVGTYRLKIYPDNSAADPFHRIAIAAGPDRNKIINVEHWGSVQWSSFHHAYSGTANLQQITADDVPDLSLVTDMSAAFSGSSVTGINHVNTWNVSNITNFSFMFESSRFNQDIGGWDVSSGTDFSSMFRSSQFNQDIGDWDVSNGTRFNEMFSYSQFNQDIGGWDVSSGTNFGNMFMNSPFDQNLGKWQLKDASTIANIFANSGMSCESFSATLLGWANYPDIHSGLYMGTNNGNNGLSFSPTAKEARDFLVTNKNWSFPPIALGCVYPTPYITVWKTDNPSDVGTTDTQISVPAEGTWYYQWEEVSNPSNNSGATQLGPVTDALTIDFPAAGTYRLKISPAFEDPFHKITFGYDGDRDKIINVEQWGDVHWSTFEFAYNRTTNLQQITADDVPDLSSVTSMMGAFSGSAVASINHVDTWDVSNVTDFSFMFASSSFNQNIADWDVSNSTNFSFMFRSTSFNQPIGEWKVGNGINFRWMFESSLFNQPIDDWDVSHGTNFEGMFYSSQFNQDIGDWDVSSGTDFSSMFYNSHFNQPIGDWDVSSGMNFYSMFRSSPFNQDVGDWNVVNGTDFSYMFLNSPFDQNLGKWQLEKADNVFWIFTNSAMSCESFSATLIGWANYPDIHSGLDIGANNGSNKLSFSLTAKEARDFLVTNKNWTFPPISVSCLYPTPYITVWKTDNPSDVGTTDTQISVPADGTWYYQWEEVSNPGNNLGATPIGPVTDALTIDFPAAGTYRLKIFPAFENPFHSISLGYGGDRDKIIDVEQWGDVHWSTFEFAYNNTTNLQHITADDVPDISLVTNMANVFAGSAVTSINNVNNWDVSNVRDFSYMFNSSQFDQDIESWDVSSGTNFEGMFYSSQFNQPIGGWNVSRGTDFSYMFSFSQFNQDIGDWDVSNGTNFSLMFGSSCFNQPIGDWDVSNGTNFSHMFYFGSFNQDIGDWEVVNGTDFSYMFYFSQFNQDIGGWHVCSGTNFEGMFYSSPFNKPIGEWDVSSGTDFSFMFGGSPFNQDIGDWDVSRGTDFSLMFTSSLFNQDIGGWNVSKGTNFNEMFSSSQFNQDIGDWDVSSGTDFGAMFLDSPFDQNLGKWQLKNASTVDNIFSNSTMSCENFSATLIGWANYPDIHSGLDIGANNGSNKLSFSLTAKEARDFLVTNKNWTFPPISVSCLYPTPTPYITVWKTDNPSDVGTTDTQISVPAGGAWYYQWEEVDTPDNNSGATPIGPVTDALTIDFPTVGTYRLKIFPAFEDPFHSISLGYGGDRDKIIDIEQWGDVQWSTFEFAYNRTTNLLHISANDVPDLSLATSMEGAFFLSEVTSINHVNNWDMSNITDFSHMFDYSQFNQDIGDWNVSNGTNFSLMFRGSAFNQPIGGWDVGKGTNFSYMFNFSQFNQDIGDWDVSSGTDFRWMFYSSRFNQPIGGWNVSNGTNFADMFGSSQFNQDIGDWDVSSGTDFGAMFSNSPFDQYLGKWQLKNASTISNIFSISAMSCENFSATLIGWANYPDINTGNSLGYLSGLGLSTLGKGALGFLKSARNWTISGAEPEIECTEPQLLFSVDDISHPTTCGGADGSITFKVTYTADGDYTLKYMAGVTEVNDVNITISDGSFTISGLSEGTYSDFEFKNQIDYDIKYTATVTLTGFSAPVISVSTVTHPNACEGTNGSIDFNVTNLTNGSYTLNYKKDNASVAPVSVMVSEGLFTLSSLSKGSYSDFSITPANGCTGILTESVAINDPVTPKITAGTGIKTTTCDGSDGSIPFTTNLADGSYSLTFTKNGVSSSTTVAVEDGVFNLAGLTKGIYAAFSITASGCTGNDNVSRTISDPALPTLTIESGVNTTTCSSNNGSITFTTSLPDGTYTLNSRKSDKATSASITVNSGGFTLSGLNTGLYDMFSISLVNGCTVTNTTTHNVSCPCEFDLNITLNLTEDISSGTETKRAPINNGKINASNKISNTARVNYEAASIELLPGFSAEAKNGAVFRAVVGGCH